MAAADRPRSAQWAVVPVEEPELPDSDLVLAQAEGAGQCDRGRVLPANPL